MKAIVDQDTCIGCGLCPDACPEVFQMGDDDLAHVILDPFPPELEAKVKEAVESCPVDAISTTD
jgi:ferredoxin